MSSSSGQAQPDMPRRSTRLGPGWTPLSSKAMSPAVPSWSPGTSTTTPVSAHSSRVPRWLTRCGAKHSTSAPSYARGYVDRFDLGDEPKTVSIRDAQHHGRALILAMGSAPRPLNVPGERGLLGHGVSTSAKRDGAQFTGRDVAVIGGGDGAVEEALHLAPLARHVTLIHHRPRLRASAIAVARLQAHPNVAILTSTEVLAVHGGQHVTGLRIRDTRHGGDSTIAVAAVFVAIGQTPRSDLLVGLVELDAGGFILTKDETTRTSAEGVFAAGDLIDRRYRQAVTAAASGCAAALDAERWLSQSACPLTDSTIRKERSLS